MPPVTVQSMRPPVRPESGAVSSRAMLAERCAAVRAHSLALAAPLSPEDQGVQSMPDAVWLYAEPKEAVASIKGRMAFGRGVQVVE